MDLRVARQIARLTQQELADRAGLDAPTISALETGTRDVYAMRYSAVVHLAQALGVDVTLLFPVTPILPALPTLVGTPESEARS
jgi:transcriptional regulator with XRE-family HTH domain